MSLIWRIGAALTATCCTGLLATGAAEPREQPKLKLTRAEQQLLDLTNQARKKAKLPSLKPDAVLVAVARAHAKNMARKGELSHVLDGKDVDDRVTAAGYPWASVGENIAEGQEWTLAEVMDGWMKSRGHRENILARKFTAIGIGIARDGKGGEYFAQVFARPKKTKGGKPH